jgi:cytidylate kinase
MISTIMNHFMMPNMQMFFMTWASQYLINFSWILLRMLFSMIFVVNEYNSHRNFDGLCKVLETIATDNFRGFGKNIFYRHHKVSQCSLAFGYLCIADTTRNDYEETITLTVMSFRWYAPLVPDAEIKASTPDNCIRSLRRNKEVEDRYTTVKPMNEKTYRTRAGDKDALNMAKNLSKTMLDIYNDVDQKRSDEGGSNVFIISGTPGCGKTLASRVLTSELKGCVVMNYNPVKEKMDLVEMAEYAINEDQKVVVVINECDVIFKNMDKAQRNAMLDDMGDLSHKFIMVLTTNEDLRVLHEADDSLLRKGRVTKIEVIGPADNRQITVLSDEKLKVAAPVPVVREVREVRENSPEPPASPKSADVNTVKV